jgi:hypothetical protein
MYRADNPRLRQLCRFAASLDTRPSAKSKKLRERTGSERSREGPQQDQSFLDQHQARLDDVREQSVHTLPQLDQHILEVLFDCRDDPSGRSLNEYS